MHRSGTSAVAGLLVRLGAQGPKTLMPANSDNPAGYWESAVFHELHERLLRAAGSRWDAFTRLEPDQLRLAMPAGLSDEYRGALRTEFGDAQRFVLKDPRMCRFVPFWFEILQMGRVTPAAILVLRSPAEVARSLAVRNGFDSNLSLLIWLRHALDAEHDTRAVRRTFVRYSDVLKNWASVAERISQDLHLPWPARPAIDEAEIDRFVDPRLRHHAGDPYAAVVPSVLSDWTQRTWTALGWLHDRDPGRAGQALAALDEIYEEFGRHTSVLDCLERERHALNERAAGLEALRDALQRRIEELERGAGVLRREADEIRQELAAAQAYAEALRQSASWRVTAPLRAVYRIFR